VKIKELKEQLKDIEDETEIFLSVDGINITDIQLEHIMESCDDPTIIGFVVVPKMEAH